MVSVCSCVVTFIKQKIVAATAAVAWMQALMHDVFTALGGSAKKPAQRCVGWLGVMQLIICSHH